VTIAKRAPKPSTTITHTHGKVEAITTEKAAALLLDDIGADSSGEIERLNARVDELQAELRQREIKITGLESEIEELREQKHEVDRLRRDIKALREVSTNQFGKLADELLPLLDSLDEQGRTNRVMRFSPATVAIATEHLRRALIKHGILDEPRARRPASDTPSPAASSAPPCSPKRPR
jgi:chromosome segregation ATPase